MRHLLSAPGIVCSLGNSRETVLAAALAGSREGLVRLPDLVLDSQPYFGRVSGELPPIEGDFKRYDCRNNRLLLAAYQQIEDEVAAAVDRFGPSRVGVVIGSSTSGILEVEEALIEQRDTGSFPPGYYDYKQEMGTVAEFLAGHAALQSVAITISTACSSSGKVFYSARNLIEAGICDAVVVGGADSLCRLTGNGFTALGAVAQGLPNPLSLNRDGIVIGEGAALFVLGPKESDIELCGLGESSDAYHISAPHPEGRGAEECMRKALSDAELAPADISYLNLHGTGTPHNDSAESLAVHNIFGTQLPCSSTKALTGHTLGAAGAIEAALCWLILSDLNQSGSLPVQVNDGVTDPELKTLNLVSAGTHLDLSRSRYLLSNSFAFGGSNVSVILGRRVEV